MGAMAAFAASPEMRKAARHMAGYDYSDEERRQLIEPVAAGVLRVEPLFRTAGVTAGFPREPKVHFEYRKAATGLFGSAGEWTRPTVDPVHFPEQDNWRGMLFDLEEDTEYEMRVVGRREGAPETEAVVATAKFRTWASEVPIAETVYLDENTKFPIVISGKGRPDGWIRYTTKPGVTLVNSNEEFYTDYHGPVNVVGAEYVVLDDMKIVAGRCRRAVILMYSHDVRVRNCEITGFGVDIRPDVSTYGGSKPARPASAHGEPIRDPVTTGILVYKGMRNTVIERCWIHDPINRSTAWRYWHPFGPVGVVFAMPDHSTVFRYNDVTGSDLTPFDDGISEWGNAGPNAGLNRTAELYGNFFIFSQDDSVEIDGAQQNVAVFDNRFETALVGLSFQGNSVSPSYAYRNLFASMGDEFGEHGQTIKTSQFDCYGAGVYSAAWKNILWGGGSGVNVCHADAESIARWKDDSAGRIARFDVFDNTFCGRQKVDGADVAVHCDTHGNRLGVKLAARDLPTDLPARPLSFTLDAARVDVRDPFDRAPRTIRVKGGKGERFRIARNAGQDWYSVSPAEGTLHDGLELTISFDSAKLKGRPLFRSAFQVRTDDGLSRPVSLYVAADYRQSERCEKPGVTAVYAKAGECAKDAEGFDVYAFTAPKDGRYFLMACAQAPDLPMFRAQVNGEKLGYACLQTCPDYPVWSIVSPNNGFDVERWRWRGRVRWYDLKAGEKVTLRIRPYRGACDLRAFVLTDDAYAFEPRTCRTSSTDLDWME